MALDPKQDITRKADIAILNRILYGTLCRVKDVAVRAQLTLNIMDALEELENAMHRG